MARLFSTLQACGVGMWDLQRFLYKTTFTQNSGQGLCCFASHLLSHITGDGTDKRQRHPQLIEIMKKKSMDMPRGKAVEHSSSFVSTHASNCSSSLLPDTQVTLSYSSFRKQVYHNLSRTELEVHIVSCLLRHFFSLCKAQACRSVCIFLCLFSQTVSH